MEQVKCESIEKAKDKSKIPVDLDGSIRIAGLFGFFLGATLIPTLIKVSLCTPYEKGVNCAVPSFENLSGWLKWVDDTEEAIEQWPLGLLFLD